METNDCLQSGLFSDWQTHMSANGNERAKLSSARSERNVNVRELLADRTWSARSERKK